MTYKSTFIVLLSCFLLIPNFVTALEPKVVSLAPSITEIIYALHGNIVGNTIYCDFPMAAQKNTKVGDLLNIDVEKVISLKPNIIFSTQGNNKDKIEQLKKLNYQVVEFAVPRTPEELLTIIKTVGTSIGREKEAFLLNKKIQDALVDLTQSALQRKTQNILILLYLHPLYAVAENTWIGSLFQRAGFTNIFPSFLSGYASITRESLFAKKIDRVFLDQVISLHDPQTKKTLASLFPKGHRRYISLPKDIFVRFGPRILEAIKFLKELDDTP